MDRREAGFASRVVAFAALALALVVGTADAAENRLKVVISSTSFAWFPLYVADGAGYFKDANLPVEIVNVKDGATVVVAILNGDADVAGVGANAVFAAREKKQPVTLLTPMTSEYTSVIFGRKDVLEKKGITAKSPITAKVEALKGLKIGVIYFNGAQHNMFKYLMAKYGGGADIDKVAEVVPIGDSNATLAAMRRGAIDVTAFSPPVPERAVADGYATVLFDTIRGDIPETRGMVFTGMAVTEKALHDNRANLAAFVRALDRANKLIHTDLNAAGAAARVHMKGMTSDLYEAGVLSAQAATPTSPEVSVEGLKKYRELLTSGGTAYAQGDFDYGAAVANDFVRAALADKKTN